MERENSNEIDEINLESSLSENNEENGNTEDFAPNYNSNNDNNNPDETEYDEPVEIPLNPAKDETERTSVLNSKYTIEAEFKMRESKIQELKEKIEEKKKIFLESKDMLPMEDR